MSEPPRPSASVALIQEVFTDAIRFWELRRIAYNVVLTVVVVGWLACTWPHFRNAMTLHALGVMVVLAVLANVCYSAAYVVDVPMQLSNFRAGWQRWRWMLWLAGTLFAVLIENYYIGEEIYPYVPS